MANVTYTDFVNNYLVKDGMLGNAVNLNKAPDQLKKEVDEVRSMVDETTNVKLTGDQTIAGVKTFNSSPIVPTPTTGDNSTKVATTAFVKAKSEADSIGVNQTWQDMTASRSMGVTYTNTTGKPIVLALITTEGVSGSSMGISVDNIEVANQNIVNAAFKFCSTVIIPNNSTYKAGAFGVSIQNWSELR